MMRSQVHVPGLVPMHESVAEIWPEMLTLVRICANFDEDMKQIVTCKELF